MSILELSLRTGKLGRVVLIAYVFQILAPSVQAAYARGLDGDEGRIENARWRIEGNVVVITYDLIADANLEYEVKVVLRRQNSVVFQLVPRTVAGAVGKGKFAGTNRVIRWEYQKDVQQGLYGDDYYFEITALPRVPGSGAWLISGLLVVGGGVVAYFLFKPEPNNGEPSGLPEPPKSWPPGQ